MSVSLVLRIMIQHQLVYTCDVEMMLIMCTCRFPHLIHCNEIEFYPITRYSINTYPQPNNIILKVGGRVSSGEGGKVGLHLEWGRFLSGGAKIM